MQAVHKFKESLVMIDLGDGLTSAIHFSYALPLGESEVIPGSIIAYFFHLTLITKNSIFWERITMSIWKMVYYNFIAIIKH